MVIVTLKSVKYSLVHWYMHYISSPLINERITINKNSGVNNK